MIDQQLMDNMRLAQRLVSLGHAARNTANLKVRQPLAEAMVIGKPLRIDQLGPKFNEAFLETFRLRDTATTVAHHIFIIAIP